MNSELSEDLRTLHDSYPGETEEGKRHQTCIKTLAMYRAVDLNGHFRVRLVPLRF